MRERGRGEGRELGFTKAATGSVRDQERSGGIPAGKKAQALKRARSSEPWWWPGWLQGTGGHRAGSPARPHPHSPLCILGLWFSNLFGLKFVSNFFFFQV